MAAWETTCPSPQFVYTSGAQFKTVVTPFESGKEQRRKKWSSDKRYMKLVFGALSAANLKAIMTFFIARCGRYETFTFTNVDPEDSTTYTVRFKYDTLEKQFTTNAAGRIETEFEEVV